MQLRRNLDNAIALSNDTSQAQIILRDLESNAQSARSLADNFLQLYMVSVQQQSFPITEARVITQASVPLSKSSPKSTLILLAALVGGCILGMLAGIFRDLMDRAFRTVSQVEQLLETSCLASIPLVEGTSRSAPDAKVTKYWPFAKFWPFAPSQLSKINTAPARPATILQLNRAASNSGRDQDDDRLLSARSDVARAVLDAPFSRFAEAMRSIKLAADLGNFGGSTNKVLGMTSALPNEGKSTISEALAHTMAQSGLRTILVDGDIRNPSLTSRLTPQAGYGLIDIVLGQCDPEQAIWSDPQSGLDFLPCVLTSRFSNSGDVLGSAQMARLFEQLRANYDRIVLDFSPLGSGHRRTRNRSTRQFLRARH